MENRFIDFTKTDPALDSVFNDKIVTPGNELIEEHNAHTNDTAIHVTAEKQLEWDGNTVDIAGHIEIDTLIKHKATQIEIEDAENNFTATNLEGAVSELFTNVSDGKDLVGGAITDVDDSVVIPTDPTFNDLASAIGGISTGKKWVSGIANTSNDWGTSQQFEVVDESITAPNISVEITGIGFIPSFIILTNIANKRIIIYSAEHDGFATNTVKLISNYSGNIGNAALENYKGNKLPAYVNENGFKLPVGGNLGLVFNWIAIE